MRTHVKHLCLRPMAMSLAALSVTCLTMALAVAQQPRTAEPQDQPAAQRTTNRDQSAGQDRVVRQVPRDSQHDDQLTAYFTEKLLLANHCEKELSKIALERSKNPEVKQFAQTLIDDHLKLDKQLAQIAPQALARFAEHARSRASGQPAQVRTSAQEAGKHDVLTQLCAIEHRAAANKLAMSKQMLESYQGQDFDMAFLGMQIGGHAWLLSELKALDGVGSNEFQKLIASTTKQVEEHLSRAQALSKKFEDDRGNTRANANTSDKT